MKEATTSLYVSANGPRAWWNRAADVLSVVIAHPVLALVDRVAIAAIFFLSGRTKVDGS